MIFNNISKTKTRKSNNTNVCLHIQKKMFYEIALQHIFYFYKACNFDFKFTINGSNTSVASFFPSLSTS